MVNFKRLADKAKQQVEKRGGTENLKRPKKFRLEDPE